MVDVERGRGLGGFEARASAPGRQCRHLAAKESARKKVASAATCGRLSMSWRPCRGALEARWA